MGPYYYGLEVGGLISFVGKLEACGPHFGTLGWFDYIGEVAAAENIGPGASEWAVSFGPEKVEILGFEVGKAQDFGPILKQEIDLWLWALGRELMNVPGWSSLVVSLG